jgi:hypothetical protein
MPGARASTDDGGTRPIDRPRGRTSTARDGSIDRSPGGSVFCLGRKQNLRAGAWPIDFTGYNRTAEIARAVVGVLIDNDRRGLAMGGEGLARKVFGLRGHPTVQMVRSVIYRLRDLRFRYPERHRLPIIVGREGGRTFGRVMYRVDPLARAQALYWTPPPEIANRRGLLVPLPRPQGGRVARPRAARGGEGAPRRLRPPPDRRDRRDTPCK